MDHHTLAIVSIVGSSLDVLGALYLAYDLLGGEHGPLRTLSRGVTYGILFAVGYGIPLGPVFGIACGATHGFTLAWELSRASRGAPTPGLGTMRPPVPFADAATVLARPGFSGPRSESFSAPSVPWGRSPLTASEFALPWNTCPLPVRALPFARCWPLSTARPVTASPPGSAPEFAHRPERALWFGLRIGLTVGLVTADSSASTPFVEWGADHIPEKRMGVFGVLLILLGSPSNPCSIGPRFSTFPFGSASLRDLVRSRPPGRLFAASEADSWEEVRDEGVPRGPGKL